MQCTMDAIWEVERRACVRDLVIDSVHIWPLLRIYLHENLFMKLMAIQNGNPQTSACLPVGQAYDLATNLCASPASLMSWRTKRNEFRRLLSTLEPGGWRIGRAKPKDNVLALFLSYSTYRDRIGGLWVDRFCDPLIHSMAERGHGYVFLERQNNITRKRPALHEAHYINHELALATAVAMLRRRRLDPDTLRGLREAKSIWESMLLPHAFPSLEWIFRRFAIADSMSSVFLRWMRRTGARIGISASYYSITGLAFNLACRRAGIPSVDIQHGLQNYDHCAYAEWLSLPEKGYEVLPTIFWCWSDMEKEQIENWGRKTYGAHWAVVGGNVWHEFCAAGGFASGAAKQTGGHNILVTLQPWPMDITGLIADVIKLTPSDWIWWLRLHPQMREQRHYDALERLFRGAGNVRIREATETPLPALLRYMDLHVTANSSAIFEASQFGVRSIMTDGVLVPTYQTVIDKGMAAFAGTPAEVAALARSWAVRSRVAVSAPARHLEEGLAALYAAVGL